ncbi:hypothetical protein F5Y17DRAFT_473015 [Xylariaceae sp. FL0594]|nr:hypothetical protein F5Y17DRAFT_473015 [Xylariaceae sp. FL0594]
MPGSTAGVGEHSKDEQTGNRVPRNSGEFPGQGTGDAAVREEASAGLRSQRRQKQLRARMANVRMRGRLTSVANNIRRTQARRSSAGTGPGNVPTSFPVYDVRRTIGTASSNTLASSGMHLPVLGPSGFRADPASAPSLSWPAMTRPYAGNNMPAPSTPVAVRGAEELDVMAEATEGQIDQVAAFVLGLDEHCRDNIDHTGHEQNGPCFYSLWRCHHNTQRSGDEACDRNGMDGSFAPHNNHGNGNWNGNGNGHGNGHGNNNNPHHGHGDQTVATTPLAPPSQLTPARIYEHHMSTPQLHSHPQFPPPLLPPLPPPLPRPRPCPCFRPRPPPPPLAHHQKHSHPPSPFPAPPQPQPQPQLQPHPQYQCPVPVTPLPGCACASCNADSDSFWPRLLRMYHDAQNMNPPIVPLPGQQQPEGVLPPQSGHLTAIQAWATLLSRYGVLVATNPRVLGALRRELEPAVFCCCVVAVVPCAAFEKAVQRVRGGVETRMSFKPRAPRARRRSYILPPEKRLQNITAVPYVLGTGRGFSGVGRLNY